ncbi:MAG: polysaccharide deacetylase family protein [Candidatus Falkowbacteria bacterium]
MFKLMAESRKRIIITAIICLSLLIVLVGSLLLLNGKRGVKNYQSNNYGSNTEQHLGVEAAKIDEKVIANANIDNQITSISKPDLEFSGLSVSLPILMYHYVETPTATTTLKGLYLDPKIFAEQLMALNKNNYDLLFMSEAAASLQDEKLLGNKNIVLTFDDGYEDFYTEVFPLLKKYNYKATLYIIINKLGAPGYLTREQVKELASSGLVEIGSHTFNHPDLRVLKDKDAKFEITASKKILEQISGRPVTSFAYPFGYYKTDFFALASSTGYTNAVSVIPGLKQGRENIWLLRRLRPGDRSGEVFVKWLDDWSKSKY